MEKVLKLNVDGLDCAGCAEDMRILLRDTEGIEDASVDFAGGIVEVRFNSVVIDAAEVVRKVRGMGFAVRGDGEAR